MASSNEDRAKTSSQSTAIKAEAKKPQEIKSPKPTNATPVRKGIKLAVGTAIVALIAGLYAGYNTLKLQQTLDHQTVTLTSHIEQLKQQQIASKNDLSATTQLATQSQIKLQTRLEELTNNRQCSSNSIKNMIGFC